ncbi:hypothetical protein BDW59DRAFT_165924 [Aspergillus cavernicola]|uniref:DUF3669 domain-containing protein n=1 Tax=Aspergillus cavernicola TaxID=176166 RepID=A0ABR4HQ69_9EURO
MAASISTTTRMKDDKLKLRRIGAGFCGTVWAAEDRGSAFKREDGGPHRSLTNDYNMHRHIWSWLSALQHDPRTTDPPCSRITKTPFTERYCPAHLVSEIMNSDRNRDCLIRLNLGRHLTQDTSSYSRFKAFSLRNYPLHVDQMEELGIPEQDIVGYARTMAGALAAMHWAG